MSAKFLDKLSNYYIPGGWKSFVISLIATIVVGYFHYSARTVEHIIHFFHYYLFYLIVIYAAHKFGFLGGLVSSFVLSFIYEPKVYMIFHLNSEMVRPAIEVMLMYTLGIFSGIFSQRLYLEKEKLRKVSEELQQSLNLLEKSIEEKIRMEKEIAKADRLRVLGQLTTGIAHEIRNPLAAIRSGVNLIKSGRNDSRIIDVVTSEIDRLNNFIERFLQYAKVGKIEDKELRAKELLEDLTELVKLTCKDRDNLNLEVFDSLSDNVFIRGDKNYLKQAIFNVILNSIEAVSTKDHSGWVSLRSYFDGGYVVFEVDDNGLGIDESLKETIFEPFFTTKETGTGLGLTIAAKVVKEHGGEIFVNAGKGAKFTIKIPGYLLADR